MFMHKMGQRGTWGNPGGPTMPPHHVVARPGSWPRHGRVWAPWPFTCSSTYHFTLSRPNTSPLFKPVFLLFFLVIFDLLAQPIFAAEIWGICSPVCDSSDYPSRILFGGVFLEYFGTVGDRLCELTCLIYA